MKTLREMIDIVNEGFMPFDTDHPENLANRFAELYYGDYSSTDRTKLVAHIFQQVTDGELSIEQLKKNIAMLEKEKGIDTELEEASPESLAKIDELNRDKY